MSFKDFLKTNKIDEATNYYADELNSILPADQYGIQFQFTSSKGKTKWITLNDESRIALQNFLKNPMSAPKQKTDTDIDWEQTRDKQEQIDIHDSEWTIKGIGKNGKYYVANGSYTDGELVDVTDIEEISEEEYNKLR